MTNDLDTQYPNMSTDKIEEKYKPFQFKSFSIEQAECAMKVGTDGVLLGAWVDVSGAGRILDIGTGTGVIAIMLAQRNPDAVIHAVEINEAACELANKNMTASPWNASLQSFHSPVQDYAREVEQPYDLIVSNPPFFSGGTFSSNQDRNNVRHTIKLPNGDLLSAARKMLSPEGRFCVILPYLEGLRFVDMARNYHLFCTQLVEVHPKEEKGIERLLIQLERVEKPTQTSALVIQHDARNDYTAAYRKLTGDFYLNM